MEHPCYCWKVIFTTQEEVMETVRCGQVRRPQVLILDLPSLVHGLTPPGPRFWSVITTHPLLFHPITMWKCYINHRCILLFSFMKIKLQRCFSIWSWKAGCRSSNLKCTRETGSSHCHLSPTGKVLVKKWGPLTRFTLHPPFSGGLPW